METQPNDKDIIQIDVLHEEYPDMKFCELRFCSNITLQQLKTKLEFKTGTPAMKMIVYIKEPGDLALLKSNNKTLHELGINNGTTLFVRSEDASSRNNDSTKIPKFKISDEKYSQRKGTIRQFLEDKKKKDITVKHRDGLNQNDCEHHSEVIKPNQDNSFFDLIGKTCFFKNDGLTGTVISVAPRYGQNAHENWIKIQIDSTVAACHEKKNSSLLFDGQFAFISTTEWKKFVENGKVEIEQKHQMQELPVEGLFENDEI